MTYTLEKLMRMIDENYGSLYLTGTLIDSLPNGLTVRENLHLSHHLYIKTLPDDLAVGGNLYLACTSITSLPEGLKVGGDLYLADSHIKSLPKGLTVGGRLNLNYTGITSLPEGLKIGGDLHLIGTRIKSLPKGLKVGGNLYHEYLELSDDQKLHDGDYELNKYIYCDGILTFIKNRHRIDSYTYYRGYFPNKNVIYDGTCYAHCHDLKSGIAALEYKHDKDRDVEQYGHLTLDSVVSKDQAITMYRVITGACQAGTENFINGLKEIKDSYTIQEIIDLTRGQYGSDVFEKFFTS